MRLGLGITAPDVAVRQAGRAWTPADLGSALLGWWDAEDAATLVMAADAVASWTDKKSGLVASQATPLAKPAYGATSFNGRPGLSFNGATELTAGSVPFPTGGAPSEIWALVDQTLGVGDAGSGNIISYGGTTTGLGGRSVRRLVSASQNRAGGQVGDATQTVVVNAPATDNFTGRHVVRLVVGAAASQLFVDGAGGASVTLTPTTGSVRTRIGANNGGSASNYFTGVINAILVTSLLGAPDAPLLLSHLKTRGGIP